ncbi:hypothetical protein BU24DRAFT_434508 [Aaosphaeria arxii CBS 175.79]|uniref:DUF1996 domain-containing protein n=1 Tax=Aaosphaeria arxii CBS 175.79 TaxID=1450172 RepID=A0A6A5XKJ5_9PLEO|nr:uncharacterized protein BU24DRAFT_434508 [Aaosphaeria arxii CBS 175.79]KAF2013473.1 hypothetical protein BU24DRAFT_434508 [Aaosphaeria arxii CBS 175.79]
MRASLLVMAGTAVALTDIEHKPFMRKNMDPLVSPGKFVSHMHSFYGSDAITKDLPTTEQLQKGCPSGENPNDLSIYWAPTLYYVNGDKYTEVYPATFKTYYENIDKAEIPFPKDLAMIAGNASAKSQADIDEKINMITWWCDAGPEDRDSRPRAAMPRVTCSAHMQAILRFPDCVDPNNIKKYSYAAANGGRCPTGMKRMPSLRFSMGDGYCFHGDFINGWYEDAALNMLKAKGQSFMRIDGAHGMGKQWPKCKATDADPSNGTNDYHKSLEMMSGHN